MTLHCVLVNLNGHMHLDSLGSSICIWVRDDETHTQLRIGQNTYAYACAKTHSYADVFWPIPECICVRTYAYEFETHLEHNIYMAKWIYYVHLGDLVCIFGLGGPI